MELNNITHNQESPSELAELSNTKRPEPSALDSIIAYRGATVTRRTNAPMQPVALLDIIDEIRNSANLAAIVQKIRALDNKDKQDEIKKYELPYFTLGRFKNNYLINKNYEDNRFPIFDLDDLNDKLDTVRKQLETDPTTFILFTSPSGNGLKLICEFDSDITDGEEFRSRYKHYASILENRYGIKLDPKTHNPGRACYLSYDSNILVNTNRELLSTKFVVDQKETKRKSNRTRKEILQSINNVKEGDRNSSVVSIAGTLYARNIDLDFSLGLLRKWNKGCDSPLPEEELVKTINHVHSDYRSCIDYTQDFTLIHEGLKKQKVDDVAIDQEFFLWLQKNKQVQFFTDERGSHYVYWDKKLILLDRDSSECQVLLLNLANISTEKTSGRVVCQVLHAKAHVEGTHINRDTWLHTDLEKLAVYINLKNQKNELVRISPDDVNVVQMARTMNEYLC